MRKNATILFVFAFAGLYLGQPTFAQSTAEPKTLWTVDAPYSNWFGTANNVRGLTYNPSTDHLIVGSRDGGLKAVILDAATGDSVGMLSTKGISGGVFPINQFRSTTDGQIFTANLVTDGKNVKIYRWANEGADPEVVFTGDLTATVRYGDALGAYGSGNDVTLLLSGTNNGLIAKFHWNGETLTKDGEWTVTKNVGRGGYSYSVTSGNQIMASGTNATPRFIDLDNGVQGDTLVIAGVTTKDLASVMYVDFLEVNSETFVIAGPAFTNGKFYLAKSTGSGYSLVKEIGPLGKNANGNNMGATIFDKEGRRLFLMDTNNQIHALDINSVLPNPQDLTFTFPKILQGNPGDEVSFDVKVSDPTELEIDEFVFEFSFDSRFISIDAEDVVAGNVTTGGFFDVKKVYETVVVRYIGDALDTNGSLFSVKGTLTELIMDSLRNDSTVFVPGDSVYFFPGDSTGVIPSDSTGYYSSTGISFKKAEFYKYPSKTPLSFSSNLDLPVYTPIYVYRLDAPIVKYAVNFNVYMDLASNFNPQTHDVYIAGSAFGPWDQPGSDMDYKMTLDKETIYKYSDSLTAGTYQYKYFLVPKSGPATWDNGEWPGDPNRSVIVDGTGNVTVKDLYSVKPGDTVDLDDVYGMTAGAPITVEGIILVPSYGGNNLTTAIQSGDRGLGVYWSRYGNTDYKEVPGQKVRIVGEAGYFNNLTQVYVTTLQVVSSNNDLPVPTRISSLDQWTGNSDLMSTRVTLENVFVPESAPWPTAFPITSSGFDSYVVGNLEQLADTFAVRIDKDVPLNDGIGLPRPTQSFNISGLMSVYKETVQLLPFSRNDVSIATSIDDTDLLPVEFELRQNYPNPFNPSTQITFALPSASEVKLEVYNVVGQRVATLVNAPLNAGYHTVNFDAANLASGLYIYRITAGSFAQTKSMTLIK